jgi:hypothetical protein
MEIEENQFMQSYLSDKSFVDFVLEKGSIPFIVRGSLECKANFSFAPLIGIQISGPSYKVKAFGENTEDNIEEEFIGVFIRELTDETIFPGEIELPEKSLEGISKALFGLELWADFLCLAVGNPKIVVEVQKPINPVIAARSEFDVRKLDRWDSLSSAYFQLPDDERKKLSAAIWWYRKACASAYHSIFDSYTAYWNSLEILCGVAASKINKGEDVDKKVQTYLAGKSKIKAGHILECYNQYVNYSIAKQIKDALAGMLGDEQAEQMVYQCFEILPDEDRLYQIRNDINHGNIKENSAADYQRVHTRCILLSHVVMTILNGRLGHPISIGMGINEFAKSVSDN